jgi:hypothetical protein
MDLKYPFNLLGPVHVRHNIGAVQPCKGEEEVETVADGIFRGRDVTETELFVGALLDLNADGPSRP